MSTSSTNVWTEFYRMDGRIASSERGARLDVTALKTYLMHIWGELSDSLQKIILDKMKRVLALPERHLRVEEVVPRDLLDRALQTLIRRTEYTSAPRILEKEVKDNEFYQQWDRYSPWAQVECVGYTLAGITSVQAVKEVLIHGPALNRWNNDERAVRLMKEACPKLENYVKIVEHRDPVSFHLILAELSALSSTSGLLFDKPPQEFQPSPRSFAHTASHTSPRPRSPRSRSPPRQSQSPPQQPRVRSPFRAEARSKFDETDADSQGSPRIESPPLNRATSPVHAFPPPVALEEEAQRPKQGPEEWESWVDLD
ncbi:uncharacterized protein JCM6883_001846 [Sporobolomyces salmoneus]|uniref:uncharacterized protein n=1 Tax=Sporobolomyces salmoneus TaxID=183962 RepID=UPI0031787919